VSPPLPPLVEARLAARPEARAVVEAVWSAIEARPGEAPLERWRRVFDEAGRRSPEAAVALYSLGEGGLLDEATAEVVAWLERLGLLGPGRVVLDLGCGIGRVAAAIEGRVGFVVGLDVSPVMLAEARRRTGAGLVRSAGADLGMLRAEAFDLAVSVDAWPYVVDAGLEASLLDEIARVLRAGGDMVILNWSYRGDAEADIADCAALAARAGLTVAEAGARPFERWDGAAFRLRKA
jgi:SAM-dependent methyltransferase